MRRHRQHHRDRLGEPNAGKSHRMRGAEDRVRHVRPRSDREARRDQPRDGSEEERRDRLSKDEPPRAHERDHDENARPEPRKVGEEPPHRVEPARDAREKTLRATARTTTAGTQDMAIASPSTAGRRSTTSLPRRARGWSAGAAKSLMPRGYPPAASTSRPARRRFATLSDGRDSSRASLGHYGEW